MIWKKDVEVLSLVLDNISFSLITSLLPLLEHHRGAGDAGGLLVKVKEELDKVRECERFLLMAEKESIERFSKNVKDKESRLTEKVI